ncbi:Short-chain-enoyl-CoA hydratase [Sulfitobacter indolifex]|uniref:Enoyl-CoA hydratase n=1 Tax=Sulfitobacter indolifex HEL-45 TaxID=391624 RepID=A0ABM9XB42_9RHOB|nr:enoyl-CoA hydratase/isomerase family protein [Sulfitobacter indolifex]EDQ06558.1 enoyl-CoA hydratase [Sulfitobacter indolifex HEL-45]UOA17549.1 Short-chain-enoyl-CoA hydratase [Sulfitobacter indolifex]
MNSETPDLSEDLRDGVLWITFERPEARNALTFAMYERLAALCSDLPTDGTVRAVVISGAGGKAFAAGTDMTQFRAFDTAQDALDYENRIDAVLEAVERCRVPTIAAINGACTGGGGSIAAACDIRIASASLKYGFPIARTLGNCLAAGNLARLSELIGAGRVRELIFTARLIEADEALRVGLVSEVLPDEASLMARATALADHVGSMAPLTLRATKEAMRRTRAATKVDDSDLITMCYMSDDFRTGIEAFLGKRKPEWTGK